MSQAATATVILLKASSDPTSPHTDPYHQHLTSLNCTPIFVPILEHGKVNEAELIKNIKLGPGNRYGGVIVSSAKAVEAWRYAAGCADGNEDERGRTKVKEAGGMVGAAGTSKDVYMTADWSQTPFYVVGTSTAKALSEIKDTLPALSRFSPTLILGSEESGTGEKLAQFILGDYAMRWTSWFSDAWKQKTPTALSANGGMGERRKLPLLYLTGDKTTETLPQTLDEGGIKTHCTQVYSTWAVKNFGELFANATEDLRHSLARRDNTYPPDVWIVFFAPSAAKSALPILEQHFNLPTTIPPSSSTSTSKSISSLPRVRFAAIGPTTAAYLHRKHPSRFIVDAVPKLPDPQSLADAIVHYAR